jgi:hypothetical protein
MVQWEFAIAHMRHDWRVTIKYKDNEKDGSKTRVDCGKL